MKYLFAFFILFFFQLSFSQSSLRGFITDAETGEPIVFGTVAIYQNGVLLTGTETGLNGFYSIAEIEEGFYDVEFSYTGYKTKKIEGKLVDEKKATMLNAKLVRGAVEGAGLPCFAGHSPPLIELDNTTQGHIFTSEQMRNMPHRGN